jgi:phospholipase/lecithinase/hemolysin
MVGVGDSDNPRARFFTLFMIMVLILPLTGYTISATTGKTITGNEVISIEIQSYGTLANVHAFETGEFINWNITWEGIDNTTSNLYQYDYTFYAGYINNGTLMFSGNGTGFPTENGSIPFSIAAFEVWGGSYEYTLKVTLWDQNRTHILDSDEGEFIIFQTVIAPSHSDLLIFGDSLSDMGTSKATYGTPESPPYYAGRWSNGPMWNEHVASGMGLTISPGTDSNPGSNRAFGGAEAGEGLNYFVIPNVGKQIEDYTNNYWIGPNEKVAVWGGGNNFLDSGETDTQKVVNYLVDHVNVLASNGASDIMVLNMPPLEKTPTYSGESDSDKQALHSRMIDFNAKLDTAMVARESALNISIQIINIFEMFESIYWNSSFYGLSNVTHAACHHSGFTCDSNDYIEPTADEFVFFDNIHVTGTTHLLLGLYVYEQISTPDTDGDGIEDSLDNCALTPIGDNVNHFGCRLVDLDSDNDGVNDLIDQCPGTTLNATVDGNGCSDYQKDSDGDGVNDAEDVCPNTSPIGIEVDSYGCANYQKDTDDDGVTDDVDSCPNTNTNWSVNIVGCAENQIDSDWDGVMNHLDTCPNTESGVDVNQTGCSLSQIDSDSDGVNDLDDQCPGTPIGTTVDQSGCALSQLDSDSDGVNDLIDICDLTPSDEIANLEGCSPSQQDSDNDGRNDALDDCPFSFGSIRGCPSMSVGIEVIHWPDSHDDSAIIQVNFSCEKNCLFTTIILSENLENQSERVFDLTIEPHEGEFEAVLRIEHLSSWAEKRVTFYWPAAPVDVEDPGTQIDENTSSDQLDEGDENTIETESWKSSQTVNYLLAILIIIGITMTIGSILRNTRIRGGGLNQQRMWHDPSTISTREVERELSKTPNLTPIDSDSELTDE